MVNRLAKLGNTYNKNTANNCTLMEASGLLPYRGGGVCVSLSP